MKRILTILLAATLAIQAGAQEKYHQLDSLLTLFYTSLEREDVEVKNAEMDMLISSCTDSLTRQHVALAIFDYYKESPLMGEEEVAIHIYDNWFKNGAVEMRGEFDRFEAEMFVDFNRQTLIGCDAPVLTMLTKKSKEQKMPAEGKTAIIYFHDTGCAKCKMTDKLLPGVLEKIQFDCRFYSIYCGTDARDFRKYRKSFKLKNRHIEVIHLWDPESESSYQKIYGVISTPKIYVTTPDGRILGRRLELDSLMELMPYAEAIQHVYESDYNKK